MRETNRVYSSKNPRCIVASFLQSSYDFEFPKFCFPPPLFFFLIPLRRGNIRGGGGGGGGGDPGEATHAIYRYISEISALSAPQIYRTRIPRRGGRGKDIFTRSLRDMRTNTGNISYWQSTGSHSPV